MTTDQWGVDDGYFDAADRWHRTDPQTRAALHQCMGADETDAVPPHDGSIRIVRRGERAALPGPAQLTLEDGTELSVCDTLPPDLPLGYHDLRFESSAGGAGGVTHAIRLIVSPGRCHLPNELRSWGVAVQLYAARSRASWGIGDLGDLRTLIGWARSCGAGVLAVNPLHAAVPIIPQEASPYFPSTRRWSNPLYLNVEDIPGAGDEPALAELSSMGRALNEERRIDRDAVHRLKLEAFERLWRRFPADATFDRFVTEGGDGLAEFARFCTLAEHHGSGWRTWPAKHRSPRSPEVAEFAAAHRDRIRFHSWLQWLLDAQLVAAGTDDMLIADLAVGIDPAGADAWSDADVLALDARVGAPPDEFNTQGQDWGIPPFVPWRLRAAGYEPFIRTIRAAMRHARGIRIDHVMGLFRLFWIPPGGGPSAGAYVRSPGRELLDIVALESVRAGAFVVGEDLGTVETEVRRVLAGAGVLSYRLAWFEPGGPEEYPVQALAALTTHDLPTVAGLWSGSDLAAQTRLDLHPNVEGTAEMRDHLQTLAGADEATPAEEVLIAAHQRLAAAPSMLVTATLDDMLATEERPNMPGTLDQWPNWCLALPQPIDDLPTDSLACLIVAALATHVRGPSDDRSR